MPIASFTGVVALLVALGYSFFPIWRKSNNDAQAYGAFLGYVATAITVLVTLVYVFSKKNDNFGLPDRPMSLELFIGYLDWRGSHESIYVPYRFYGFNESEGPTVFRFQNDDEIESYSIDINWNQESSSELSSKW